jgi:hypothetical protein
LATPRVVLDWQAWAPPLNPPDPGGLPADAAQAIADAFWLTNPHLCSALQWESYAATLPPAPSVAQVSTGAQAVSYSPPMPGGDYGAAMSRAAWHRSLMASLDTAVLVIAPPGDVPGVGADLPPWWPSWPPDTPPTEPPPVLTPVAPVAAFTFDPATPSTQDNVTFDGTTSTGGALDVADPLTEVIRYDWLFNGATTRSGPVVTWRLPSSAGNVTCSLTVYDENGATDTTVQVITI